MKSILEDLYNYNEEYAEKIPKSEEYKEIFSQYDGLYKELLKTLNDEQQKILDELFYLISGLEAETGVTNFKAGFKYCLQLVLESVGN